MRKVGWWFVLTASVASVLGGVTTVSDALGGVLVGLLAANIIRYAFGTSAGVPSLNRIRAGLADLDLQIEHLDYSDFPSTVTTVLETTSVDGDPLLVERARTRCLELLALDAVVAAGLVPGRGRTVELGPPATGRTPGVGADAGREGGGVGPRRRQGGDDDG